MFGFGKKKAPEPPPRRNSQESKDRKAQSVAQLGFLVGVGNDAVDLDVDDDELEDELMMLLNGEDIPIRGKPNPSSAPSRPPRVPPPVPNRPNITKTPSDVDFGNGNFEIDDDDVSDGDLDDPELMAELGALTGEAEIVAPVVAVDTAPLPVPLVTRKSNEELLSILVERLQLYEKAKSIADLNGDSVKSRRFARSIKTIKELQAKAKSGKVIDEEDIPPPVALGTVTAKAEPLTPPNVPEQIVINNEPIPDYDTQKLPQWSGSNEPLPDYDTNMKLPEPLVPTQAYVNPTVDPPKPNVATPRAVFDPPKEIQVNPDVEQRLKEYKRMAVGLKRSRDLQNAKLYLQLSKALDTAIKSGDPIELSSYPEIPSSVPLEEHPSGPSSAAAVVAPAETEPIPVQPVSSEESQQSQFPGDDIFGAPPAPKTILEALEQRLEKYKSEVEKAKESSNANKARRIGRIVKQYEDAISAYKKGKPVVYEELPSPPGFAPIPVGGAPGNSQTAIPVSTPSDAIPDTKLQKLSTDSDKPKPIPAGSSSSPSAPSSTQGSIQRGGGKPATKLTLQEKQLNSILTRQKQYKDAAIDAKKRGDIEQAREFLRTAKGFDKLIQVSQAGLPVDMATLPAQPDAVASLETDFEVISEADCIQATGSVAEIYNKLEEDLKSQMKMCMRTRDHFRSMGDIGSSNRFESYALESKRDLDTLRLAVKKQEELPKYHYETRIFSITECNTDINEDEIEISVLQGVNYKVSNPSDIDTYVRVELPFPSAEEAQSNKTAVVKDTNNPVYNATYKMTISRTTRNFQRFVHRHGVKFEIWSKGGFLRGSTMIGQTTVKLQPLETKCTLHDAFDILEGRRSIGKLEVKIRIRDPVLTKQISQKKEKWLSIDRV